MNSQQSQEWPALAAPAPDYYLMLPDDLKEEVILEEDYCVITYPDRIDCFMRAYMLQKVTDSTDVLDYGVWVSVSRDNLMKYMQRMADIQDPEGKAADTMFNPLVMMGQDKIADDLGPLRFTGFLSTQIHPTDRPYENLYAVRMDLIFSTPESFPEAIPQDNQMGVSFVRDYYNGISREEAIKRVNLVTRRNDIL